MLVPEFYQSLLRTLIDRFGTSMPVSEDVIDDTAASITSHSERAFSDADRAQNQQVFELQWGDILSTWVMLIAIPESGESEMTMYL